MLPVPAFSPQEGLVLEKTGEDLSLCRPTRVHQRQEADSHWGGRTQVQGSLTSGTQPALPLPWPRSP